MMMFPGDNGMVSSFDAQCRRICVSGVIGEMSAAMFLEQISAHEFSNTSSAISVYINSYGGDAHAMMLMYDAIRSCSCPITTIAMGSCMSAATLLLAAGDKGNRFISENCRTMIHMVSSGAFGSLAELEASVKETKYLQDQYIGLLSKETDTPKAKILKDISNGDFYMNANQSILYGLADKIVPTRKQIIATPTKQKSVKKKMKT